MKIRCPHCSKEYTIPDERLKALRSAVTIACPSCRGGIDISPGQGRDPSAPAPPAARGEDHGDGSGLKERILGSLKDLPPMPQVAQKAREVMAKPTSSFSDLAKVIEADQAIVARVLKIANSPYYGLSGKVSSVRHAAVVLGSKTLMEMLNLACSSEILGQTLAGYDLEAGDLWTHSLGVAAGAQILALRVKPELEQDAFSAGLIHDAGKIILDPYIRERKQAFRDFVSKSSETFLNAERHILGFDHAELAAEACRIWQIPAHIAKAIRHHHDPAQSQADPLSFIVHTADAVAMMSGIGAGLDGMLYALHPEAVSFLKLKPDDLSSLMGRIAEFVDKTTREI